MPGDLAGIGKEEAGRMPAAQLAGSLRYERL
jgi:hypothetical protein